MCLCLFMNLFMNIFMCVSAACSSACPPSPRPRGRALPPGTTRWSPRPPSRPPQSRTQGCVESPSGSQRPSGFRKVVGRGHRPTTGIMAVGGFRTKTFIIIFNYPDTQNSYFFPPYCAYFIFLFDAWCFPHKNMVKIFKKFHLSNDFQTNLRDL